MSNFTKQTLNQSATDLLNRIPYLLTIAGFGAIAFVWVQVLSGTTNIATFVGEKIVEIGGYAPALASPIGWTVHLVISLQYALLFTVLLVLPIWPKQTFRRGIAQFAAAIAIGFIGTWVANPAISVTASLLGGAGWPAELYPINTSLGVPLYNHLGFFVLTLVATEWVPCGVRSLVTGWRAASTPLETSLDSGFFPVQGLS